MLCNSWILCVSQDCAVLLPSIALSIVVLMAPFPISQVGYLVYLLV